MGRRLTLARQMALGLDLFPGASVADPVFLHPTQLAHDVCDAAVVSRVDLPIRKEDGISGDFE